MDDALADLSDLIQLYPLENLMNERITLKWLHGHTTTTQL